MLAETDAGLALTGLALALGATTLVWLLSLFRRDASIIDVFWGLGFVLLAWAYRSQVSVESFRQTLVPLLVTVWGVRLSVHIFLRNRGLGEDYRYVKMRRRYGSRFPALSLVIVFWLQAVLLWIVAWPLLGVQIHPRPDSWTVFDVLGLCLFGCGLFFEAVGDAQLVRFKADPANRGRVMDRGLWRYTRHPNYCGDFLVWWGLYLVAREGHGTWWTIVGPLVMSFLLIRVSGVAMLETTITSRRPGYPEYIRRTGAFFPRPPRRLP